jgi:phosphonopyruvate decarboxylase
MVVVLDGDGNLLMNLGVLAMVAAAAPRRFVHVVLDNESYQTTGGQPTLSPTSPLDAIALACGYRSASRTNNARDLGAAALRAIASPGPAMLLVKVSPIVLQAPPRISVPPEEMARRFRTAALGVGVRKGAAGERIS